MNVVIIGIFLTLVCVIVINVENVNAQQNNNTTGTTSLNFTKILAGKAFETCIPNRILSTGEINPVKPNLCFPSVDVLYQGKKMLVLQSRYFDEVWKAVEIAKENGYTVDGITTYATDLGLAEQVAMSKD